MREFVQAANAIGRTSKKNEKIRILSELFQSLAVRDAELAAQFFTGRPFAQSDERVVGVGGATLARAVAEAAGKSGENLGPIYRTHGDLGDMAESMLGEKNKTCDLPLDGVAALFQNLSGARSQSQKASLLQLAFAKASPGDIKYIVKILTGDLRIGSKESLVEESIARAFARDVRAVRRANLLIGDIGETLRLASEDRLESATVRLFHPLGFMLASPVETPEELFAEAETPALFIEQKYDGIRAQVHKNDAGKVKIFSRTRDEVTEFPELYAPLARLPGEFILDGEIVAWRDAKPLPFTELQKRLGRKRIDLWMQHDIPVKFVAFDVLFVNGSLLLNTPLDQRKLHLKKILNGASKDAAFRHGASEGRAEVPLGPIRSTETYASSENGASEASREAIPEDIREGVSEGIRGAIRLTPVSLCKTAEDVASEFRASLAAGHEGIVAKSVESFYTPGRRGREWLKLKLPYATLDVVVTAAEYGHGKRHKVLSDVTFAVRDGDKLLNIGKAYSGLTDKEIEENTTLFLRTTLKDEGFRRIVEPSLVLEVAFNNIQRSTRHNSGFALRFPRIVRIRHDKPATEVDTLERVRQLFANQVQLQTEAPEK